MNKLLIGMMFLGMNTLTRAMHYSDAPQQISFGKSAVEASFRQRFKDCSYLDVAYAKIPEETIDLDAQDPLQQKPLKEIERKPGLPFMLARVATDSSVYYCEANGLHKKLGIGENLLNISDYKDPRDNKTPLRAINYYQLKPGVSKCCVARHNIRTAFKDFKSFLDQQTVTAQSNMDQVFESYEKLLELLKFDCKECNECNDTSRALGHIAKYEKSQTFKCLAYIYGIGIDRNMEKGVELLIPVFKPNTIAENGGVQPFLVTASWVAGYYMQHIRYCEQSQNYAAASRQCDLCLRHLKECREYGEQQYPVYSDQILGLLGGMQEVISHIKKIVEARIQQ